MLEAYTEIHSVNSGMRMRIELIKSPSTELQSEALSLLIKTPNGQHNTGLNREMWVPNPAATSSTQLAMFEFLGKILGLALYSSFTLNLDLPAILWKPLVGQKVELSDVRAIDTMCVQSLDALKTIDQKGITEDTFGDVFLEVFAIHRSDGKEVELKPNGKNIEVTFQNRFGILQLCKTLILITRVDLFGRENENQRIFCSS